MFQSNVVLQGAHGAETHNMDGEKLYEMLMILLKVFKNAPALSTSLGLEGARKIYFKVAIEPLMFQPMWVEIVFQGTRTLGRFQLQCSAHLGLPSVGPIVAVSGPQKWAQMRNKHPQSRGFPARGTKSKHHKSNTNQTKN